MNVRPGEEPIARRDDEETLSPLIRKNGMYPACGWGDMDTRNFMTWIQPCYIAPFFGYE